MWRIPNWGAISIVRVFGWRLTCWRRIRRCGCLPHGVAFALDDFGAGFTAFRFLKDFFFDLVKIDRHFIRDIQASPDNQVLTEALITVTHQFEMFAVAQGVETAAEVAVLQALGVDCMQGYHFGFPKFSL
jgi:EAL domain-containing protein (putative c-di-GMP-specific phosphodiesterase class I)